MTSFEEENSEDDLQDEGPQYLLYIFIMKRTIPAVKDLMNKEESPTFEDLLAIPWETTNELGVYLKLIFENLENRTALSHFVYIGSAILRAWSHVSDGQTMVNHKNYSRSNAANVAVVMDLVEFLINNNALSNVKLLLLIENAEKIQAREAAMTGEDKTAFRARRAAQSRGYRATKNAKSEGKAPNVVSAKNIRRNALRKAQWDGDALQAEKAKLQQRVSRARDRLKKAKETGDIQRTQEATLALKIAEVERWEFAVEHGNSVKIVPSKEDRFPWTVRCMGSIVLFMVTMITLLLRTRLPPRVFASGER
ncbi:hypothetical protein P875_00076201 [Aspergillus parasiticus SU-1]|uniref:Uncharacterized protein n=1 Tax=Aspergillus parasiticus (strain ATCC 56775 / NRRL 5862 / SRRC 143 / SU-1) TaxID=1403190 RepID=A0A0F0ING8_ASPPU|nr:hypothetical protein P875_00076201 [Aspergillus parasiticus SU-1]